MGGYSVEFALELAEEREGGLAHQGEDAAGCVLGRDFEAAGGVLFYEFLRVLPCGLVEGFVGVAVQEQVVAHAAPDEGLPDAGQLAHGVVDVEQRAVVTVEVGAHGRVYARWLGASAAQLGVAAAHAVHVGRRPAQIRQVSLETGQCGYLPNLVEDGFLAARHDVFALMGGYGAEGASAEASAVQVHGEAYHLVGGYGLVLVSRVGQARVGQCEGGIELGGGHGRTGRVDHDVASAGLLDEAPGLDAVRLFFYMPEVFGVFGLVFQAGFVRVEHDVAGFGRGRGGRHPGGLRHVGELPDRGAGLQPACDFAHRLLTHAINEQVGAGVGQYALFELAGPVVVMGEPPHGCFYAAYDQGHVGIEAFDQVRVGDGAVVRPHACLSAGRIGVVGAEAFVRGVVVDHGVHASGAYGEKEPRPAEFLEVAQVVAPVGLGHYGHAQALCFQGAAYDGGAEGGMVHIGIARKEDDVHAVPAAQFEFLAARGQEIGQVVLVHRAQRYEKCSESGAFPACFVRGWRSVRPWGVLARLLADVRKAAGLSEKSARPFWKSRRPLGKKQAAFCMKAGQLLHQSCGAFRAKAAGFVPEGARRLRKGGGFFPAGMCAGGVADRRKILIFARCQGGGSAVARGVW